LLKDLNKVKKNESLLILSDFIVYQFELLSEIGIIGIIGIIVTNY